MEHYFTCPYCDEQISMVLDVSVRAQTYIEDCEVCCKPIQITYSVRNDTVTNFEAKAIQ
jgi:transcription elongation factor Elf1